jgi:hypothetical protein
MRATNSVNNRIGLGHVPIAEVNEGKIPGGKAPFRHDFDEATTAHRFRLYQRRQIADAAARLEAPASDRKNYSSTDTAEMSAFPGPCR